MADKKKMSVEDILAACRGGGAAPSPSVPDENAGGDNAESASPPESAAPASAKQVAKSKPPAPAGGASASASKSPGSMSIADILAAARSGGAKPAEPSVEATAAKPAAAPKAKPAAAKPAAAKATAAKADAPTASATLDTSSILAAARSGAKPGPISKAEAAAKAPVVTKSKPALLPMPEKPAYAQPKAAAAPTDRRGFFSVLFGSFLALGFTTFGITNLLWVLGLARFMFPNILIEPPSKFRVGFPGDFAPGSVSDKFKAQFGIWVVNAEYEGQTQIVALKTVCTHLGCTPNWLEAEQKFKCPCHGSGFYKDGVNFEGPAPRPLERYAISIAADGQLEIDKSKTFQQEMGQWSNPSSFVPV